MSEKGQSTELSYDEFSDWKEKNPIVVPQHIVEELDNFRKRFDDPTLAREEFQKLNEPYRKRMQGETDDDYYFQLEVCRRAKQNIPIMIAEDKLRICYCGSGFKFRKCHGK